MRTTLDALEPRFLFHHAPATIDYEQYLIELINRARANPTAEAARHGIDLNEGITPGTITTTPKQPLAYNPNLSTAARGHSKWMLDNQLFQHEGPGNNAPADRMSAAGYVFNSPFSNGENLAWRGSNSTPDVAALTLQEHADLFIDAGIAGRGHRTNLMHAAFKEVGTGVLTGTFQGFQGVMVTEDFASSGLGSFLTGVAYDDHLDDDNFYTPGEGMPGLTITAKRLSDNQTFTATTSAAGGYSLRLDPGTYEVTASGPGLDSPLVAQNVTISLENVKQDFVPAHSPADDVTVDFPAAIPTSLKPGQKTKVTVRFTNPGTTAVNTTLKPALYFSLDNTLDDSDILAAPATSVKLALASKKSTTATFNITAPLTVAIGNYRLLAATTDDLLATSKTKIKLSPATLNLVNTLTSKLPATATAGKSLPFSLTLRNAGNYTAAGNITLALSLKPIGQPGATPITLPSQTIKINLASNASIVLKRTTKLPSSLADGKYQLIATVTPTTLRFPETPTKDNTAKSTTFQVT